MTRRSTVFARLGVLVVAPVLASFASCRSSSRHTSSDLALAIAASESLTTALADSVVPSGYAAAATGRQARDETDSLSACEDRVDGTGWERASSSMIDLQVPPGFTGVEDEGHGRVSFRGHDWFVNVSTRSRGWTGSITNSCDLYISGLPARLYLVRTLYGRGVHATIRLNEQRNMEIDGQARSAARQAELLHVIRYARISSASAADR